MSRFLRHALVPAALAAAVLAVLAPAASSTVGAPAKPASQGTLVFAFHPL